MKIYLNHTTTERGTDVIEAISWHRAGDVVQVLTYDDNGKELADTTMEEEIKMTKEQIRNKEAFISAILAAARANGKELDYLGAVGAAEYIHRNETTLSRLAEMECDGRFYNLYWKDGVNPKQERAEARIEKYIRETIGCNVHTQRDPRGYCVRLYLKIPETGFFYNSWDGETSAANW